MRGLLNTTCTVTRPTLAKTGFGGDARTFGAHLSDIPCRHQVMSAKELGLVTDGQTSLVRDRKLWAPFGTDIQATDRVAVGGTTYDVVDVDMNVAGAGHHIAVRLREVTG